MSSQCCRCKSLFADDPMTVPDLFSSSYRLNSRVTIRENMSLSRDRPEGSTIIPLTSIPQSKTVEGGIHVVSNLTSFSALLCHLTFSTKSTSVVTWEAKHQTEHDSEKASNSDKIGIFN